MAKLFELPAEQSICCIPLKHAVYCQSCLCVSNSWPNRCGMCGNEAVLRLEPIINRNPDPPAQNSRHVRLALVRAVSA